MASAEASFTNVEADVTPYYNDLDIEKLEEFRAKATNKAQVMFDFFYEKPIGDRERSPTNARVQLDIVQFGFYIGYASQRKDGGYTVRRQAYRAIHRLRKTFANYKLSVTTKGAEQRESKVKFIDVTRESDIPGLVVFRMVFETEIAIQV